MEYLFEFVGELIEDALPAIFFISIFCIFFLGGEFGRLIQILLTGITG